MLKVALAAGPARAEVQLDRTTPPGEVPVLDRST
jgi:hypothetical protein